MIRSLTRHAARPVALLALSLVPGGALLAPAAAQQDDVARWERQAQNVTIVRDDWGIAHVRGRTDADAVFGVAYAQAEDDFNRVETNFVNALGRLAEIEGEAEIYRDLRMKLFIDPDTLKTLYAGSPDWLKALMDGWAAGLNYYLHTHPEVKPRVIDRFEPWMALSFSEGSIGGDIESVSIADLEAFYGGRAADREAEEALALLREPSGSNGFAIAPSNTANGDALLLINPHTSFFFRAEAQMTSDEGLNAYGALTWGQFFIYQGFNEHAGWMHTTSGVDRIDEFAETIVERDGRRFYRYGGEERPLQTTTITVPYRTADGDRAEKVFTVYKTHRGPVVREEGGKWISVALLNNPVAALEQSFLRTKVRGYEEFVEVSQRKANSSNNTIFADSDGNIAYFHPQFVPRRNDRFDYTEPVDGSDPATDWQGLHELDELPHLLNPATGWIQNTNNWPYSAAGPHSPKREDFPRYMDTVGENARGVHALLVLEDETDFTLQSLIDAAYDSYLPAFAQILPPLLRDYDALPASDPRKGRLAEQVAALRGWDFRWGVESVPTSLAVFWGEEMFARSREGARRAARPLLDHIAEGQTAEARLAALEAAVERLEADFGGWRTPWGQINRFQRISANIVQEFEDSHPSTAVGFTSAQWGSLASFGARRYPGTKRYYGTSGNSFVAVVEFGDRVRARAVSAGGQSGRPGSPHFVDQAERYATGDLREVYFYPDQLEGHTERTYRPGR